MSSKAHAAAFQLAILRIVIFVAAGWRSGAFHSQAFAEETFFEAQVAPLLESRCLGCHSDNIRKGDFSLTTIVDVAESGFVDAESPGDSHLLEVVTSNDGQPPRMPKEGPALSDDEIETLKKWISDGAPWPDDVKLSEQAESDGSWWSLQPLAEVTVPAWPSSVQRPDIQPNEVDHFIAQGLNQKHLQFNPQAARRLLIRRAYYDLTGLPPDPAKVEAFISDDDPQAWASLIDELLESERYGERWGRHWLDVVRFGESNGFERNVIINELWPFRDYVIRSINNDKPFHQFIREHLAGDILAPGDPSIEIGSAFLVAGPYDNVGNQDAVQQAQIRANTIDEMIRATSEAFLGLTVGCARCHDHKFDPIRQADYYSMYATFSGVRHGVKEVATAEARKSRNDQLAPLQAKRATLDRERQELAKRIQDRADSMTEQLSKRWVRPAVSRSGIDDVFEPVEAKFVRFVSEGQDRNLEDRNNFRIDEFEVWSADDPPSNIALSSNGTTAKGASRNIADFPGAYGPELTIDGKSGARYIATGGHLTLEFPTPRRFNRVVVSSAKNEPNPDLHLFVFVSDYRIESSMDGESWTTISSSTDRKPINDAHRILRLKRLVTTKEEEARRLKLHRQIREIDQQIAAIPALPRLWVGSRDSAAAKGPFHLFVGGSPQRRGAEVTVGSLDVLQKNARFQTTSYQLPSSASEADRRMELAKWITSDSNPLTPRVLANRIWHYHFGTGLVSTPSDFGYMGALPSHPELLDWLTGKLIKNDWRLKDIHRLIMNSATYQQSSAFRPEAASVDAEARLLWRFPIRRLSAEEIRDSMLHVAGVLNLQMGGPGFRLYEYQQDNVATYVPLGQHGPETYRRSVYHQNARASVVDLMTEFDQPDCAFGAPRRSETTTPLQALTTLNHSFTLDMASALANRLKNDSADNLSGQIKRAFQLCYGRPPTTSELERCRHHVKRYGLPSLCRVLFNTSELIYVR